MRRTIAYPLAVLTAAAGTTLFTAAPASAHGYVSAPPSRQALCAAGAVPDCGPIQFEPQSVEGPKGQRNCHGGLSQFAVLSDESRDWPAKSVGSTVTFSWTLTARHRTSTWEYFVGGTRVAVFDDRNQIPDSVVTHRVDLSEFPGRQKVLAIWNIGDTPMAFYNCIDLNIGGGSGSQPPQSPSQSPAPAPSTAPTPAPSAPAPSQPEPTGAPADGAEWRPGVTYKVGDVVTYEGTRYRCRQGHTTIRSWEPVFTPALWLAL
ncbi:lytic polysaccharide monooxygenase [Actinomadura livida]|uniref:Chitin-binding protein n=1 Tax=Actinomadura livida TaxID=79909 RepID=A0A7W7IBX7_9ACTN|nr:MULTISPECIES: lytic polysaccharide monooxygenase [Actinomadura]MBB4774181.1 chitin-binding protein [Actinomadura catellatispora]GGT84310.1 cellulose-binding protein [Actinomadura livida]